jgi:hypothetical protein
VRQAWRSNLLSTMASVKRNQSLERSGPIEQARMYTSKACRSMVVGDQRNLPQSSETCWRTSASKLHRHGWRTYASKLHRQGYHVHAFSIWALPCALQIRGGNPWAPVAWSKLCLRISLSRSSMLPDSVLIHIFYSLDTPTDLIC